jgi:hypothetical protein
MFKDLNIKKSLITISQFSMGDYPTEDEVACIQSLGLTMTKTFNDREDEHLLQSLYTLTTRQSKTSIVPYSRIGEWWKYGLGFQHIDPVSDIRGCGILSLQNLIYFLRVHPKKAGLMLKARAQQPLTENAYHSFPWACAGINLTRMLALEFEVILPSGFSNIGVDVNYSKKTCWRYLNVEDGFNRMFVCLFLLLDFFWDEMRATYMEFNKVLKAVSDEFILHLALSTSLIDLENRIHKRIQYIDPDVCDYTSLPDPETIPYDDIEGGQSFSSSDLRNESTTQSNLESISSVQDQNENPIFAMFTNHMPSYENMISTLVPEPADSSFPVFATCEEKSSKQLMNHNNQQLASPYCMQIV